MPIRVLLADDHTIVRQGVRALLEQEGFTVIGEACDGQRAVQLVQELHPDVAVLDLNIPFLNGIDASKQMHKVSPQTKVLLLTMYREDQYVLRALRAGVKGYMLKTNAAGDLVRAIHEVTKGRTYLDPSISESVVHAVVTKSDLPEDPLSDRERQVLQLIAEGKTTKEVATVLGISVKTAESHRTRLMSKLDIHDTATLVRYAISRGLIQVSQENSP